MPPSRRKSQQPAARADRADEERARGANFGESVRIAQAEFDKHQPQIVVGESRGGTVAMNIKSGDAGLVPLCPGWKKWGTVKTVNPGTVIVHSQADNIVPFADSEELVQSSGLPATALIEIGLDHWLNDAKSLLVMLKECERLHVSESRSACFTERAE